MSHNDRSHEALTEQELRDLDAADGVIDGKVHGTDLKNFTHDATKSTREGEWEFRDGKYWRRDYYGAALPPKKVEAPREIVREVVKEADHSECRRLIEQKETLIRELHRLLAERDTTISSLKARISSLLMTIEKLEIRITTLETELRSYQTVQVVQPAPIVVNEPNSYYVTRSNRGAQLLQAYGKQDIVVGGGFGYYGAGYQPVTGFTPVVPTQQMAYTSHQQFIHQPAQVQMSQVTVSAPRTTTTTVRETAHVHSGQNEYYNVDSEAMRARLDAMDGVIDGKLNGVDIRMGTGHHGHLHTTTTERVIEDTHGREYYNVDSEAMRAKLDAMDGVIDGKFNGNEINVRGGGSSSAHRGGHHQVHQTTRSQTTLGGASQSREYYRADNSSDAHRLDAMDGVIDGRLHGTDIVTKGDKNKRRK
jgi:hypothetical protein